MAYTFSSVAKPSGATPGFQKPMDELILFRTQDIDTMPARDDKGVVIAGNIVLAAGANMISVYCTPKTIEYRQTPEGDPDSRAFVQELKGNFPGYESAVAEFITNNSNENLMALLRFCDGVTTPKLFGSICAPLQMEAALEGTSDKTSNTLTLKSMNKGPAIAIYNGTLSLDTSGSGGA